MSAIIKDTVIYLNVAKYSKLCFNMLMIIDRDILSYIKKILSGNPEIILLYGPRQAGKTTLINNIIKEREGVVFLNGDDIRTQELLSVADLRSLQNGIGMPKILVIDEAQRITNIGLSLKLLFDNDQFPIIASGSSSFDLANKVNEPLTGRAIVLKLYPFSILEIPIKLPNTSRISNLEEYLRFGMYPKVVTTIGENEKQVYLQNLINQYLYKDILTFETVRKPKKIIDLLTLLALQIGSEVSIDELAKTLSISKIVVEKYLDLLEKMFVILNIRGFSRNLRKEISKTSKYYFLDLGLRNALIQNFNPLNIRSDTGGMFENFCIIERLKAIENHQKFANYYFWRTYDQKEIDLVEEREGKLFTYEFKWSLKGRSNNSSVYEFQKAYPNSVYMQVTPDNLESFLTVGV